MQNFYAPAPEMHQLNILKEVARNANVTQAELAKLCALSVAMVNNYMKEICAMGSLEYRRRTAKTVTYHLTPSGMRHLEVLQSRLINEMVDMFALAKEQIRARLASQTQAAPKRVILYGSGHLAQLTFHALERTGVSILGVCDDDMEAIGGELCGRRVLDSSEIRSLAPDAVIVADSVRTEEICRSLSSLPEQGIRLIRLDCCPGSGDRSPLGPSIPFMRSVGGKIPRPIEW
jgi:FlaA1/EpsC-like NDP-sugar epimerase